MSGAEKYRQANRQANLLDIFFGSRPVLHTKMSGFDGVGMILGVLLAKPCKITWKSRQSVIFGTEAFGI